MPDPTRPVAGAPIDTDWGQQVHDRVFQPKGVRGHGAADNNVGSAYERLPLDTADDDPGGWLTGGDSYEVPAGAGGLYLYVMRVQTNGGSGSNYTKVVFKVNSIDVVKFRIDHDTLPNNDQRVGVIELAAGDSLTIYAAKNGGGNPDVFIQQFDFIIMGTSIGA
jgi:hypothetical protein